MRLETILTRPLHTTLSNAMLRFHQRFGVGGPCRRCASALVLLVLALPFWAHAMSVISQSVRQFPLGQFVGTSVSVTSLPIHMTWHMTFRLFSVRTIVRSTSHDYCADGAIVGCLASRHLTP